MISGFSHHLSNAEVVRAWAGALRNMTINDDIENAAVKGGAAPLLITALKNFASDATVAQHVIFALSNLCVWPSIIVSDLRVYPLPPLPCRSCQADNKVTVAAAGAIAPIVAALTAHSAVSGTARAAASTLRMLSNNNDPNRLAEVAAGVIPAALAALKANVADADVVEELALMVRNMYVCFISIETAVVLP